MPDSFTHTTALQFGAATLKAALTAMGLSLSEQAFFWLLGQAYGESGLGLGDMAHMPGARANFLGTNNWGAVYCGSTAPKGSVLRAAPDATCQRGAGDTIPGGGKFVPNVTKYPSPLSGAKGFVGLVTAIPGMSAVLADPNATTNDFARTLYKVGYFGGFKVGDDGEKSLNQGINFKAQAEKAKLDPKNAKNVMATQEEADEANIRDYAHMVDGMANAARKSVGSGPIPALVASGTVDIPTDSMLGRAAKIGVTAGIFGGAAFALLSFFKTQTGTQKPKGNKRRA